MQYISSQRYRDQNIIDKKIEEKDFDVYIAPFCDEYALVVDGHHAFDAAKQCGVEPNYINANKEDRFEDYKKLYAEAGNLEDFLFAQWNDSDYYDIVTGIDIW